MHIALFDFDGTIADSGPTIMAAASATLRHFGYPVPPPQRLRGFVGPPLPQGITEVLGLPPELVPEFRTRYRATYVERMTEAPPFPGIPALLTALAEAGWVLGVASSKREDLVVRILAAQGLGEAFTVVAGADRTEHNAGKAWVLGRALALLSESGMDGSDAVLVGDRHHDVEGAAEHGLRTVFAAWGYGAPEESEGAWAVAESPAAVGRLLLG
ncbi:MAG: HAD family hydrolase [Actinomycetota bacterium]